MNYFKNYFLDVVIKRYAQLKGRASRGEFWSFVVFSSIIIFIVGVLGDIWDINSYIPIESIQFIKKISEFIETITGISINSLQVIVGLILLIPFLATSVRRLHDICKSGWWYLLGLIPLVGAVLLTVLFILPSESKTNRYGTVR